ncbi:hypothetical protein PVAND_009153 [Polypedilum vanderplanki]|uniref:Uncharacterized protein n=1 Tax=Polypedilum vanderplanki TaxID=319348 RepID=A0A9J6CBS4_POLVA|nr:hypothetical protein PVAND_009153 [Polypedilum vanderplanki]
MRRQVDPVDIPVDRIDAIVDPVDFPVDPPLERLSASLSAEIMQAAQNIEEREARERQNQRRQINFSRRAQNEADAQHFNIGANSTRAGTKRLRKE